MRRVSWLILPAVLAVVVPTVWAGDPGHKCNLKVEECLTKMTAEIRAHGYLGLDTDKDEMTGEISVKRVLPGSPAEEAGIEAGDVLLAMNGISFGDSLKKEALMASKKSLKVGSQVTYLVRQGAREKKVSMRLAPVPDEVLAQWVGHHMLEHVAAAGTND